VADTATGLAISAAGVRERVAQMPASREDGGVVYVLPSYDVRSSEHYAHVVPFLEEVGRRVDLAVVVERATGAPPLAAARHVAVLPRTGSVVRRALALARALVGLRRRGYRRVFVRISVPAALVAGTVGRLAGMRSFYWNSGQGRNLAPAWGPGPRALLRRLRYEAALVPFALACRAVHRFVTGPEGMAAYYARAYGVDPDKITVLYNDIDVPAFRRRLEAVDRAEVRRALGVPAEVPVLLFVGRVSPLKGGPHLLPLAGAILDAHPTAVMLVVGEVHLPRFPADHAAHRHRDRVRLCGPLANAEITRAFAAADVFLLPSNSEGFPRVLLECMAAGLPFVAFDVGGVREIAPPAQQGYVVPRGDVNAFARCVLDLLADPSRRLQLGHAGRERVQRYGTPEVADMFVARVARA
jgi:glycosyltransferase involved in cell wall biosynthesis